MRVVHYTKAPEIDAKRGRANNPSWAPLLEEVTVPPSEARWQTPLCKAFEWWLAIQRGVVEIKQYAFRKELAQAPDRKAGRAFGLFGIESGTNGGSNAMIFGTSYPVWVERDRILAISSQP